MTNDKPPSATVTPMGSFAERTSKWNTTPTTPKPEVLWPDDIVTHVIIAGMGNLFAFGSQAEIAATATGEPEGWITLTCVSKENEREPMYLHREDVRFVLKSRTHAEYWADWWKQEADDAKRTGRGTPPRAS